MKSWTVLWIVCMMAFCGPVVPEARCETVRLPITIDPALLRSLIVQQAYPEPGETAKVLDHAGGCAQVILSAPQVGVESEHLRYQTAIKLKLGTLIGEKCFAPIKWTGSVLLLQRPRVNEQWQLSFDTYNSTLLDPDGQPAKLAGLVWNQVKEYVHGYLQQIAIDLAPPVGDVKSFLLPLFDDQHRNATKRFFAGMRPEQPLVTPDGLLINILAEAETSTQDNNEQPKVAASPEALAMVMESWQTMDALLIHLMSQFSGRPLTDDDRFTFMDTMLTVRYAFEEALSQQQLTNNFVREQFVWSWQQLQGVFRRHLAASPTDNLLGYLAFFTAADALVALDNIGPAMGIEISRDGFHRLAELVSSKPLEKPLQSTPEVNTLLREILGLDSPPEVLIPEEKAAPPPPVEETPPTSWYLFPGQMKLLDFLGSSRAWAGELTLPGLKEIRSWTTEAVSADTLLQKVGKLLSRTAGTGHKNVGLDAADGNWFERMVIATAWQESCFRQFHVKKNKLTYLLSYNQTSVGLMQVNERVWRGIYDREQLRWNVQYNARAGVEILVLYLNRYIKKQKAPVDLSSTSGRRFLAVWLYALYNGGPSQLKKLPQRYRQKHTYQSEQLFLAKYDQAEQDSWERRVKCL